ncbi:retrovirus-related pol polyprotein from transposon TNT 1-94 [Tanacetum coccineum]
MKAILRKDKCLAAIDERPAEVTDDDAVLSSIEEKKSAKEIWDHLARLYEARSHHNKNFIKRKLYALHMTESTSVTEHVNNLNTLFSQLTSLSCKIDSQERAEILLQSLPDSYDQVIINLTSNVLSDYLVFDDVAAAILEEENRRNNREGQGKQVQEQCGGLWCDERKVMEPAPLESQIMVNLTTRKEEEFLNASNMACRHSGCNEKPKRFADVWLCDTGATFHMTARREWFHQYKPISEGGFVYSCNDHELKIIGIGSIMVKMHDGTVIELFRNVRHVEGMKKNLFNDYWDLLDDLGCKVEIQNKIMKIIKGELVLMRGKKVAANLYQLKGEIIEEAEASVASHSLSHRVIIAWHQKLGHMSEQGMKILVERKLLPGLIKALSLGGAKYFVSFIDDYSRRCWVYPIKKKSDLFKVFKVYKARVELDSGKKIKCLRTDNRGEYTGDEFDTFCRQEGIKRQFTTAYTPQQNGVAERMNRTLLEKARVMLATASLVKSFWAEAVNTACYVINRSPSTAVELKTPIKIWTGKPVNYSDLHIFGIKGYRLWDPTAHKVVVSRDVVFMEDKIQENEESDSITRETTSIQMEKEFQSNDSFEVAPQHEVNETNESQAPATRTLNQEGEPSTLQEALNNPDASFWKEAMQEEIKALHKNKTWELVPLPGGRKPIGNKWVYKIKRNGDDQVERYHARQVVKGYAQKEGIDFNEIFSPVVRMTTVRVVLEMCATYDLHLEQLDVKTAFLHGNLKDEIYMLQPEGFKQKRKDNLVCRLNKSLYGLKQAPRCWYKRFDSFIRSLEYNRLHADPCAYFKRFENNDFIILLLYVDDMLVAGPNKDRINKLKAQLAREFEMKDLGPVNKILGMKIHRDRVSRKIWLSQKSYVKKILQRFNMQDYKPISTPFPTDVKLSSKMSPSSEKERMEMSRVPYALAVGSLMFTMICTRLNIAHAVGVVSRYMAEPGRGHWEAVKRILRYIKGTSDVALCYGESGLTVKGYVDSDYAGDLDGSKSTTGYVFTLSGGTVSWVSKLQSVVAMSTTEAEYVAAAQASKEAVWLKMLLEELRYKQEKITLFRLYLARNPAFHSKTKHIRVQYHFVREKVEEGTVDMQKIHTDDNMANYLTKAINGDKFIWCRSSCDLTKISDHDRLLDAKTELDKMLNEDLMRCSVACFCKQARSSRRYECF